MSDPAREPPSDTPETHRPDPDASADAADVGPIPLAPEEPPPPVAAKTPVARLVAAPLVSPDDDEDYDRDPEVERALGKGPRPASTPSAPEAPVLIRPGWGTPQVIASLGAGIALGATIAAGVQAGHAPIRTAAFTAFQILLHAATGTGALALGALLVERPTGRIELGAARMLLAVASLGLAINLGPPWAAGFGPPLAGALCYIAIVWTLFRLPAREVFIVSALHFTFWAILWVGGALKPPPPPGAVVSPPPAATGASLFHDRACVAFRA